MLVYVTLTVSSGSVAVKYYQVKEYLGKIYMTLHKDFKPILLTDKSTLNKPQFDPEALGGTLLVDIPDSSNYSVEIITSTYRILKCCLENLNTKDTVPLTFDKEVVEKVREKYQKMSQHLESFLS